MFSSVYFSFARIISALPEKSQNVLKPWGEGLLPHSHPAPDPMINEARVRYLAVELSLKQKGRRGLQLLD